MTYLIMTSERSDAYEMTIDELPAAVEALQIAFDEGEAIRASVPVIDVAYSREADERKTDNIVGPPQMGLIVNTRVRAVFDSLEIRNIQYFPVRLVESAGEVDDSYSIANVVGCFDVIDRDASSLNLRADGSIRFIDSLSLRLEPGREYGHIFRLAGFPSLMAVSKDLDAALAAHEITGLQRYTPEAFSL